jgi:glycerophosphoryl diester phosphodiesterase
MNRLLLLGHRGARALKTIPENTFASFDRAIADGCDGFEFDLRLTRDGVAVICHDEKVRLVKIAHARAERFRHLPHLEGVLVRYQNNAFLDIELKVAGLEEITSGLLRDHPPARGCVVSSFLPEVLQSLHGIDPQIPLGLICEKRSQLARWSDLPIEYVMLHRKLAIADTIDQLKRARKKILVWTPNEPAEMLRFAELGIAGIISDKTELLCRTLKP